MEEQQATDGGDYPEKRTIARWIGPALNNYSHSKAPAQRGIIDSERRKPINEVWPAMIESQHLRKIPHNE